MTQKWHQIASRLHRFRMERRVSLLFMAVAVGVLSGYGAIFFRLVIEGAQYLFYGFAEDILTFAHKVPFYKMIAMPALGGLAVGLLIRFGAREARGHGVPEVMEAVAIQGGVIRKRVALVKILASALSIGSGASVGREGPIVQIGASIGSTVGQIFNMPLAQQKTMLGCGAAAGIAANFNAPIAGVLFAVEVLRGEFGMAAFGPVVIASVMATAISRLHFGEYPAFVLPPYQLKSAWELGLYPLLGLVAGLTALLFMTVLYKSEDLFQRISLPDWIKPGIGGLLVGLIFLVWPQAFGVGYLATKQALFGQIPVMLLFTLIFVKIIATSISLGSGGSGGVFAPALFIGAMTGGVFGWAVDLLFPGVTAPPAAYSLVGMGALVAGATHAPLTAILMLFEMTGNYEIILPIMIACIVSTVTTTSLKQGSIYTLKLLRKGVDISAGMEQNLLKTLKVKDFMRGGVVTVPENMGITELIHTLKQRDVSYLHMVNEQQELVGIISFRDIRPLLEEEGAYPLIIARDLASTRVVTVTPQDSLQHAMHLMGERAISQLPVVSEEKGKKVVATLREKDVVAAYDRVIVQRQRDMV